MPLSAQYDMNKQLDSRDKIRSLVKESPYASSQQNLVAGGLVLGA